MIPTVSVVLAAKNYARFLPTAVESVFAQTFGNWELVIVDDGSSDDTPAVVRPYLADRRVRYVRSDRLGQSRAKNLGVRLSGGEFVAFLDADDAWRPTKLEKQLAAFASEPERGVVFCRRSLIDEAGNPAGPRPTATVTHDPTLQDFYVQNPVCFSSAVVRREVLDRVGGFDPDLDLAIDYDLWLRAVRVTRFHCVPEELTLYRTGHANLSKKLADRVATAFSVMHRAERRGGVSAVAVAHGRSDTCRTLGYVLRGGEPGESIRWHLRALAHPHGRRDSLKGLLAATLKWARKKRDVGSPENMSVNR